MAAHIEIHPQLNLSDVAYTLKTGRAVFAASKAIVFRGRTDLLEQLRAAGVTGITHQGAAPEGKQAVCVSFSPSCVLAAEEARDLYESNPSFRQLISELSDQIRRSYPLDLRHYIRSPLHLIPLPLPGECCRLHCNSRLAAYSLAGVFKPLPSLAAE